MVTSDHISIRAVYRSLMVMMAREHGVAPDDMVSALENCKRNRGRKGGWKACQARREAIYLTKIGLDLQNLEVGSPLGLSKQAVDRIVKEVELSRDRAEVDEMLELYEHALNADVVGANG